MRIATIAAAMLAVMPTAIAAQAFDNAGVIALHRADLGEAVIAAKVRTMPCGYDVSADALIALKHAGVPDGVIAAMIDRCAAVPASVGVDSRTLDPAVQHPPGLYVVGEGAVAMEPVRPSRASAVKVSGNGSVLFPYVGRLTLPDARSHLIVRGPRPAFVFYFPPGDRRLAEFGTANSVAAASPEEFSLVRFAVKPTERSVAIGKMSAFAARRGIEGKDAIRFDTTDIGSAAFRVVPAIDPSPGQYAFVLTGANNAARVYDFEVEADAATAPMVAAPADVPPIARRRPGS